VKALTNNFLS